MTTDRLLTLLLAGGFALAGLTGCPTDTGDDDDDSTVDDDDDDSVDDSVYQQLGGETGVRAVLAEFVANVGADERINFFFAQTDLTALENSLHDQICEATGGGCTYGGANMADAHATMAITDAQFDALVEDLLAAFDTLGVEYTAGSFDGGLPADVLIGALAGMRGDIVTDSDGSSVLFNQLGGIAGVRAVIDGTLANVGADARINGFFADSDLAALRELLVAQVCEATGGYCVYGGLDMATAHAGLGISDADFDAFVEDYLAALDTLGVPYTAPGFDGGLPADTLTTVLAGMRPDIVETAPGPLIAITSPTFGTAFDASSFEIEVEAVNFTLSDENIGAPHVDGEGHYHVYVDGVYQRASGNPSTWVTGLEPGEYDIMVELTNNDHSSLDPVVSDTITVSVNDDAPYIRVIEPGLRENINSSSWFIEFETQNHTLNPDAIGDAPVAGEGHVHVYVDGVYTAAIAENEVWLLDQPAGVHEVWLVLAQNDHTELDAREVFVVNSPASRPGISITSPPEGELLSTGDFFVQYEVENFTLDEGAIGTAPVPGEGHAHVYVDDAYYDVDADGSVQVSGLSSGTYVVRMELQNNDHSELSPRVLDEVTVVVE